MRGPKPSMMELSDTQRTQRRDLQALVRRHSTSQQLVLRARVVLAAADGANNAQIARSLDISLDMARLWRNRWLGLAAASLEDLSIEERLTDAPRPGTPARISAEAVCQIVALACEAPSESGRPISQWSSREIADEIVRRGIIEEISPRHAARLLKRGISSRT
jgi:putative transposase